MSQSMLIVDTFLLSSARFILLMKQRQNEKIRA